MLEKREVCVRIRSGSADWRLETGGSRGLRIRRRLSSFFPDGRLQKEARVAQPRVPFGMWEGSPCFRGDPAAGGVVTVGDTGVWVGESVGYYARPEVIFWRPKCGHRALRRPASVILIGPRRKCKK